MRPLFFAQRVPMDTEESAQNHDGETRESQYEYSKISHKSERNHAHCDQSDSD